MATLLVPAATRRARGLAASFDRALIRAAANCGRACVGTRMDRGWSIVAKGLGARSADLGSAGWTRIELVDHALLDAVFVPNELLNNAVVVALADQEGERALGFWDSVVHPHSALRALAGGHTAQMDLVAACPAHYAFRVGSRGTPLVVWTHDPIAAELAMLATLYLADASAGYEQRMPWEDARVQAAVERGLGAAGGHQLKLHAHLANTDRVAISMVTEVARILDCPLEITHPEG